MAIMERVLVFAAGVVALRFYSIAQAAYCYRHHAQECENERSRSQS
jgi:hypothetical protein